MKLKNPSSTRFGRLDGAVLIGSTDNGDVGPGEWMWLHFKRGNCVEVLRLSDPSGVKGRFDLMLPGEPDPERLMDVRAVARNGTTITAGAALDTLKARQVVFSGDEAFFIRFTPELLQLLEVVFAP